MKVLSIQANVVLKSGAVALAPLTIDQLADLLRSNLIGTSAEDVEFDDPPEDEITYFTGGDTDIEVETESTVLAAREGAEAVTNVIPRSAVEPLVQAKTRGELIEKLGELLAPYGITIAEA
ncbi:MAG: hypothetical protein QJR04_25350 [Burkholderia multivorans]|nr:hypothetical protein [Burkholderia multivorans]